jgi:hypothetical protein
MPVATRRAWGLRGYLAVTVRRSWRAAAGAARIQHRVVTPADVRSSSGRAAVARAQGSARDPPSGGIDMKIVVGYDGSDAAKRALDQALAFARS